MTQPTTYRCLSRECRHEFKAPPGPTQCPACGGLYVGELSWYACMTQARAEAAVSERLRAMGCLTLFLHYRMPLRRHNRLSRNQRANVAVLEKPEEIIKRPCLSRYIFVGMVPGQAFYDVSTLPGVSSFVRNEAGPQRIPDEDIERLRGWGDADGCMVLEEPGSPRRKRYEAGQMLRIKHGPFQGFCGPVVRDDGKLVTVLAQVFGRQTEVSLAPDAVEEG